MTPTPPARVDETRRMTFETMLRDLSGHTASPADPTVCRCGATREVGECEKADRMLTWIDGVLIPAYQRDALEDAAGRVEAMPTGTAAVDAGEFIRIREEAAARVRSVA